MNLGLCFVSDAQSGEKSRLQRFSHHEFGFAKLARNSVC